MFKKPLPGQKPKVGDQFKYTLFVDELKADCIFTVTKVDFYGKGWAMSQEYKDNEENYWIVPSGYDNNFLVRTKRNSIIIIS